MLTKWPNKWTLVMLAVLVLLGGVIPAQAQDAMAATVKLGGNEALGSFLVGENGMTLYVFANDRPNVSACYDQCAANWPPLTVAEGTKPTAGEGVPGKLGTIKRDDGTFQVTYNLMPLYFFINDKAVGDATGDKARDVWFVVKPETVAVGGNAELGAFLVGLNGMTLYMFKNDKPGESACYDQCAANWPPLTVAEGENPTAGLGVYGRLGTAKRTDGTLQVTYNDMPLYFWVKDTRPGESTGQNVGEVWFVIQPPTVVKGGNVELNGFLANRDGMTLYMFKNDKPGESACYDQCAANWPPLLVAKGETPVAGEGVTGKLGVIERTDGTYQVTYDDMPLYIWINDVKPGDATGQGVRDVWFVIAVQ